MDPFFNAFLEKYGEPDLKCEASAEAISRFEAVMPSKLIEYWRKYGFSRYKSGLFFVTDPAEFGATLDAWIGDTILSKSGPYYVIARSGFGDLFLWHEKMGYKYKINAHRGWIIERDGSQDLSIKERADRAIQGFFSTSSAKEKDIEGKDGRLLFDRAVKRFGPLGFDEVFAFEPAVGVGGGVDFQNVIKRNVHVHLSVLSQLCSREILDDDALRRKAFG